MKVSTLLFPLIFASSAAFGQVAEFSIHGGKSLITNKELGDIQGATYGLDDGFRFGFRTTLNNWIFFGHEFGYGYNRTHLTAEGQDLGGMAIHQGFYNFLGYAVPEGKPVRPFATGGVQFSNFVPPGSSVTQGGGSTKFGFNYGGGIKFRILSKYGLRFDFRQYWTKKPFGFSGSLRQNEVSVGFGLML